jgi:hypothetical protein
LTGNADRVVVPFEEFSERRERRRRLAAARQDLAQGVEPVLSPPLETVAESVAIGVKKEGDRP